MARATYDPADYVESIRHYAQLATAEHQAAGRSWYPSAERIIGELAAWSGLAPDRVAALVAALSPRNPWKWNVQDAAAFADAIAHGRPMPSATTFGPNRLAAWRLGTGAGDWHTAAPKVRSFVANMTGDESAVTVDVWAIRGATYGAESAVRSDAQYSAIADAYRMVAAELGETPRELQAIVWLVVQELGHGSNRRGRIDLSCKRGTFAIVRELLGE